MHVRKKLFCLEEIVGRNMDVKGPPDEVPDENEEHVFGNWRKSNPYKEAKNLAELSSRAL